MSYMALVWTYWGSSRGAPREVSRMVPAGTLMLAPLVKIEAPTPTLAPVLAPELPLMSPPKAAARAVRTGTFKERAWPKRNSSEPNPT